MERQCKKKQYQDEYTISFHEGPTHCLFSDLLLGICAEGVGVVLWPPLLQFSIGDIKITH